MEWTEETISRLRSLWQEGLSTAEIGRRMSITKNAVVGKAHRLTLPPRPSPIRKGLEGGGLAGEQAEPQRATRREAVRPDRPAMTASPGRVTRLVPRPAAPAAGDASLQPAAEGARATVTALHAARVPAPREMFAASEPPAGADLSRDADLETRRPSREPAATQAAGQPVRRRGQSCCWPLGEPGTKQFRFCGGEPMPGKPYCSEHSQLAYVKLRDRRDTVA
jgi:GcrA cell cycle regulator